MFCCCRCFKLKVCIVEIKVKVDLFMIKYKIYLVQDVCGHNSIRL